MRDPAAVNKVRYVEGDLFRHLSDVGGKVYVPHVVNSVGAWGAGFVIPLGRQYPKAREAYLAWAKKSPAPEGVTYPLEGSDFRLGRTQFVQVDDRVTVCNMVAQEGTGGVRPLRYNALARCLDQVGELVHDTASAGMTDYTQEPVVPTILAPMFGAGLAGGDWLYIQDLIEDCWVRRWIPVTVCWLPGTTPAGWGPPVSVQKLESA